MTLNFILKLLAIEEDTSQLDAGEGMMVNCPI